MLFYNRAQFCIFTASPRMSPTSLPFSASSSTGFSTNFIPPPPIFTSAFNSSLISPHFPPLTLPGGNGDFQASKYEPKFETKFEPNLSARQGRLPSPPTVRGTLQPNTIVSSAEQMLGKVMPICFKLYLIVV